MEQEDTAIVSNSEWQKLLVTVIEQVVMLAGDKLPAVREAMAPLRDMVEEAPANSNKARGTVDPVQTLAKQIKANAGALRTLGQKKKHLEHKIQTTRAALQTQERQMQLLQQELEEAQTKMDSAVQQYGRQVVSKQMEPFVVDDEAMQSAHGEEVKSLLESLQPQLTEEQMQDLQRLAFQSVSLEWDRKRKKTAEEDLSYDPDSYMEGGPWSGRQELTP